MVRIPICQPLAPILGGGERIIGDSIFKALGTMP